jgi:DNA polymerase I-like protein with 3'-5' exonuclease and polymerase domains
MRNVLDVENSITKRNGKDHLDPFEPSNTLVQVGTLDVDNWKNENIITLDHDEYKDSSGRGRFVLQSILDMTTLLIMHNAQHDLMWLWEAGYKYDGPIYDTMLADYVLDRGQRNPLSLAACAERRQLEVQKDDTLKRYFKDGYNTNEIPLSDLSLYLRYDLLTTSQLFHSIQEDYAKPESHSLCTIRDTSFETCRTLTKMYMSGFRVDLQELGRVRDEFEKEKAEIEGRLQTKVRQLMGDTPINLNSPEQMSQVIFSKRIKNKKEWADYLTIHQLFKNLKKRSKRIVKPSTGHRRLLAPHVKVRGKRIK